MSKLLGIINPHADPDDQFARWLWRSDVPWEAEQLTIERMAVEDGNVQFRILGPATAKVPDGVFLKLQINGALDPQAAFSGQMGAPPPLVALGGPLPPLAAPALGGQMESQGPLMPAESPVAELNVATPEKLPGESNAQSIRRRAIALRWQASKLEKLAEDMEALEAQGLL